MTFYLLCSFIKASPNSFFSFSVFCFLRFLWIPISMPGGVIWDDVDAPTQQVVNKLRQNWGYALSSIDWNLNFLGLKKQNYTLLFQSNLVPYLSQKSQLVLTQKRLKWVLILSNKCENCFHKNNFDLNSIPTCCGWCLLSWTRIIKTCRLI